MNHYSIEKVAMISGHPKTVYVKSKTDLEFWTAEVL